MIHPIVKILVILLLVILFYEDIRYRHITIYWIVFTLVGVLLLSYMESRLNAVNILLNGAFVAVQIVFIYLYLLFRGKSIKSILREYIGIGDIAFWIVPVFYLEPVIYVFYALICYLSVLLIFGTVMMVRKKKSTIPLAGFMSLVFGVYILCEWCGLNFSFWANSLIVQ